MTADGWKRFFSEEDRVARKSGTTVLFHGIPYGLQQSIVTVYVSEKEIRQPADMLRSIKRRSMVRSVHVPDRVYLRAAN